MRIFKIKSFSRWQGNSGISESDLVNAVAEMEEGLIDADLGGSIYKKRIATPGQGKRGGARTIVAAKFGECYFFLKGYKKNKKDNIPRNDLKALKVLAGDLLRLSTADINKSLEDDTLKEVLL